MKISVIAVTICAMGAAYASNDIDGNDTLVWIALFLLALIGIFIIYVFSRQNAKIQAMYQRIIRTQKEMEQKQTEFLSGIGENIHTIVEETYKEVTSTHSECLPQNVLEKERTLLNVTADLIEFLRLKSNKVTIVKEKFNLNNVLNEVAGSIQKSFENRDIELIYDIDKNIPRYLIGDALHLEKALRNLFEYVFSHLDKGEVSLTIETYATYHDTTQIEFRLKDNGKGLTQEALKVLFTPEYDEENNTYKRLGLYVAHALVTQMGGKITVYSVPEKGTTFTINLPFDLVDPKERRHYRLPDKVLTVKNVFIVDDNYNSALALKKMFAYFRHDVEVATKEEFLRKKMKLERFDIILLSESIFKHKKIVDYLGRIKSGKSSIKVLAMRSLFHTDNTESLPKIVDKMLVKPMTQERVFELVVDLYTNGKIADESPEETVDERQSKLPVYTGTIPSEPNVSQKSFADFSGRRLLVAEDDEINRKVIANVLKHSGMEIVFAENGRQAVNTLKESTKAFDFVLMDINMPVMDGYVATQMIRLDTEFDELPVVAFTALSLESEREKIFKSGMNAYLTKPLDIGQLYNVFKTFMPVTEQIDVSDKTITVISNNIIDMKKGIANVSGNEGLYMEILQEFLDAYGESDALFEKLIKEHRFEQAKMLCIDMKGLTGAVGAKEMFYLVAHIHQMLLKPDQKTLLLEVPVYREKLRVLTQTIRNYLDR